MQSSNFPLVKFDLETRFGSIYDDEEKNAIMEVVGRDAPTSGKSVVEFERKFAQYCGTKYAITVSNGTAALMMAFKAIDIKPGDEVISTPITWIATSAAAVVLGAKIKFADVDPTTLNIDPEKIKPLITSKTKAICPVHLYGQSVDMKPIMDIAEEKNIYVIEDAAHAPGGKYNGIMTGNLGHMGCFSFHEQKNMSTLGEGGMITTNDPFLYERARGYKSHCARVVGESTKYLSFDKAKSEKLLQNLQFWYQDFDDCGYNFRMNDVTASVGICQLNKLNKMNARRNEIARIWNDAFQGIDGIKPCRVIENVYHTYHLYPILIDPKKIGISRDELVYRLRMNFCIKTGLHYMPLTQTEAFKNQGYNENDSPIACKIWKNLITLPIHPRLNDQAINYMIESVKSAIRMR